MFLPNTEQSNPNINYQLTILIKKRSICHYNKIKCVSLTKGPDSVGFAIGNALVSKDSIIYYIKTGFFFFPTCNHSILHSVYGVL